jgi:uncharacterized protein
MLMAMSTTRTLTIPVAGTPHRLEARLTQRSVLEPGAVPVAMPVAIIAPPHPVYGGTIGNPIVRAMERAFQAQDLTTVAFNFRGTGEQATGEPSGEEDDAKQDYLAVAHGVSPSPLEWLSGYSFGSVAALATAIELGVSRVLMVGTPLGLLDRKLLELYRGELLVVSGDDDEYAPYEAMRELFGARAHTRLEVLPGVEHFFLGSAVQQLSDALTRLLRAASGGAHGVA